jgi:2-oxoglutarate ferredoxin oxidoreductase subunit alpha
MMDLPYSIKIGGLAGQGIKAAGLMLARVATRSGYQIFTYTEFPSLIRGGHNVMQILISASEVTAPLTKTDLLVALNQETVDKHRAELTSGGGVLYDGDKKVDTSAISGGIDLYPVPLSRLANEAGGMELLGNTVALGATVALLGGDLMVLLELVKGEFADKGDKMVEMNIKASQLGYAYVKEKFADKLQSKLHPTAYVVPRMIVDGTEAVVLGAIAGGVQFAAVYPMSPISNILHILAMYQEKYGYIYKQPEDELSAINMAVGAAFAGARSMTATSGGGFCLMTEGLGLAAMTETPVVIVLGMRPGPATGLPTWSSQADLQFALHAHQGDFPRIVLAAGDAKETFLLTMQAFNLADKYQTPVILLIDKNICDSDQSFPVFDVSAYSTNRGKYTVDFNPGYARYALESDGISFRTIPGSGNFFMANSDEHTDEGYSTDEVKDINEQQKKRAMKLVTCEQTDMPLPQLVGPDPADVTIVSWGSNKGSILTTLRDFPNVNYVHLTWMSPFPTHALKGFLSRSKHILDVECNQTGQLADLIAEKTGINIADRLLKSDGRPIFPEEIIERLKKYDDLR